MIGDSTIHRTTFLSTSAHRTLPDAASAAPISPPTSPCVDEDGRPKYQVMRFHTIAPAQRGGDDRQAVQVLGRIDDAAADGLGHSRAQERADEVHHGGHRQRRAGVSARVETEVAMAFAASWKPLV